jgi:sulfur-oxidizing protein SoxY
MVVTPARRSFLKRSLAASAVGLAASAGVLKPARVSAAEWPRSAFQARTVEEAVKNLYGGAEIAASNAVRIHAMPQAENGAAVPIAVSVELPDAEAISIYVEKNDFPLVTNVILNGAEPYLSTRIKMRASSDVIVVCKAGGKLYGARHHIKVTVGGCSG